MRRAGAFLFAVLVAFACDSKESTPSAEAKSDGKSDGKADAKAPATADDGSAAKPPQDAKAADDGATPTGDEPRGPVRVVGTIEVPGTPLEFQAQLEAGDPPSGKISIPMQGAKDVPLQDVQVSTSELAFALANGAKWKGTIGADGKIECSFEQGGAKLPCTMETVDEAAFADAGPKRPQTPKPPFPYQTEDVEWDAGQGVHLAGTITRPEGEGPHPAIVFVSGSGQQDRDESIMGHRPFAVIADRLARKGIASLRYDDRGVGKSTGDLESLTVTKEAEDAGSALDVLRKADGIDPARVGILGHSVGGLIAPMLASKRPDDVAFVVLVAGPGVKGTELHARQVKALLEAGKAPQAAIDAATAGNAAMYAVVEKDGTAEEIEKVLADAGLSGAALQAQAKMVSSPWFRELMTMDPKPALEKTQCPVLVLSGDLDLQVVAEQNVPAIEAALRAGGNTRVESHVFEGLNHMLQPAKTGMPDEYGQIETTIDEKALAELEAWVVAQTESAP